MLTGAILAGGAGRRMGGQDKGLMLLQGRSLLAWVRDALAPQVDELLIVANRNLECYRQVGVPVVRDLRPDFPGPLAGIESALTHASTDWVVTCAVDTPHLTGDYAARMLAASAGRPAVVVVAGRLQPVFALLPRSALTSLQDFLDRGERKALRWIESLDPVAVPFDDCAANFRDTDTPADLARL